MEYYSFHHQLGNFSETYYKLVDLLIASSVWGPSRAIEELITCFGSRKRTHKLSHRLNIHELPVGNKNSRSSRNTSLQRLGLFLVRGNLNR